MKNTNKERLERLLAMLDKESREDMNGYVEYE